ncbi:MAG: arginine deiminase-related protein [Steroidobacteraceae bacterium]
MSLSMSDFPVSNLCLVEPAAFGFNAETATTNRFQHNLDLPAAAATARAEFASLAAALRAANIGLCIAADTQLPLKPDAIFPNNWVSFHDDGTVVLYPMHSPTRRAERREAVIDCVKRELGFTESQRFDLTRHEQQGRFLEGTGSLVLDHQARVAYACRSPRTDESLVREWAQLMGYEPFLFDAATGDGTPVYHTNVLLWIGANIAGIGIEWVAAAQRAGLLERLRASGKAVLLLDDAQLHAFAGNMLEVNTTADVRHLIMSASAAASLHEEQNSLLRDAGCIPLISAVPTIERLGGGSVRCMLAEVPAPGITR